ncbi:MAG: type IVB secretion system protein DotA [Legionella sp.]
MNKLVVAILLFVFPCLVLADGSMTFAPPASDYSVVFLGNLFGVVDGVLSGTGSQIMGSMFGVFNAAVLALGGIIIMYTLMVSTMNTAHEGQMLGQKWSSIWIPIRSSVGLALLIPKASGYCLMQIFVMWLVVQGVGAADKVWDAALSYLNRGGVIIQAQQINPASAIVSGNTGVAGIATGASAILAGQVCMLGLQTQLENTRSKALQSGGSCENATPNGSIDTFCKTAVPDFISSVNAIDFQSKHPDKPSWTLDMPHFEKGSKYHFLNGICGTIQWNNLSTLSPIFSNQQANFPSTTPQPGTITNVGSSYTDADGNTVTVGSGQGTNLTPGEISATQLSRAIAVQQMYVNLSSVARVIVNNDPQVASTKPSSPFSTVANQQFGVPYTQAGETCNNYTDNCVIWGATTGNNGNNNVGVLFNGTEVINAINAYNGVMMPTVNLVTELQAGINSKNATGFINQASTQGWLMAGAYFFNLVLIQGSGNAVTNAGQTDSNTGLELSKFNPNSLSSPFTSNGSASKGYSCSAGNVLNRDFSQLCEWFSNDPTAVQQVQALITTSATSGNTNSQLPSFSTTQELVTGNASSTVYGFMNNSLMMQTPGQPGVKNLTFGGSINTFTPDTTGLLLSTATFDCGSVSLGIFGSFCLGQIIGNLLYNKIFLTIYNFLMNAFGKIINQVIMAFIMIPLKGMGVIFQQGLTTISTPGVNPVVALANMGVQYINFSGNLWLQLLDMAVTSALIPVFGVFIFALISLGMPLLVAWVGVMVSIGFVTAYYVPILPYMIFVFGGMGWLMSVIEAMVAAPIVALGVTHPEGHEAFGKGEAAIMILANVFLRPSMMIIGYIAGIALSYVGVWILNAGYDQAILFIQGQNTQVYGSFTTSTGLSSIPASGFQYTEWAGIYAYFFSILVYTSTYLTVVQKSFTLITYLPDKVLRWIGGTPEGIGQETAQWGEESKGQVKEAGKETQTAQGQVDKQLSGYGMKGLNKAKGALGGAGGGGKVSGKGSNIGKDASKGGKG